MLLLCLLEVRAAVEDLFQEGQQIIDALYVSAELQLLHLQQRTLLSSSSPENFVRRSRAQWPWQADEPPQARQCLR